MRSSSSTCRLGGIDGKLVALLAVLACSHPQSNEVSPRIDAGGVEAAIQDVDGGATLDAPLSDADIARMLDTGMVMIEEVAAIIHDNEKDCAAMTTALRDYQTAHEDLIERTMPLYRTASREERRAIERKYRPRFNAAWARLRPGGMHCKGDPHAAAILDELWRATRHPIDEPDLQR